MADVDNDILRLENKVDKISDDITDIKIIMERNTTSLEYHIQRTDLAEQNIDLLRKQLEPVKARIEFENKLARFAYNTLKFIGAAVAALVGLKSLESFFK